MSARLRWLLVPLAALAGWPLAVLAGGALYAGLDGLCPADQEVSEMCVAPWFAPAQEAVIAFSAALAATLVVTLATLAAPSERRRVAWIVYAIGAVAALRLGLLASAWVPLASALAAGAAAAFVLARRAARAAGASDRDRGGVGGWSDPR